MAVEDGQVDDSASTLGSDFLQEADALFASRVAEVIAPVVDVDEGSDDDVTADPTSEPVVADDDDADDAEDATDDDDTDPSNEPPPVDAPTTVSIAGVEIPLADAQNLLQLQELIASDPAFQQHLYGYFTPEAVQHVAPAPPSIPPAAGQGSPLTPQLPWTPPDAEYLEHPVVKSLYEINLKQWEYIQNLKETVDVFNNQQAAVQRKELESAANTVADTFKADYQLNDTQIAALRKEAGNLGVVNSLMSQGSSFTDAAKRALEMAYWATPEFRTRQLTESLEEQATAKKKKAKAASISGSSGSAPRTTPKPQTSAEIRDAMIADLAEKF